MDVNDLKGLFAEVNKRMNAATDHVRHELSGVRTGRASVTILDSVHVDAYGSKMPLNQLAGLSVPEPSLIVAQPFDPSLLGAIEKAIRASDLGLNPANDGKLVRIPIPSLTEERRKELSRHVHKLSEEGRNSVRLVRRDANERLKKLLKDSQDFRGRREEGSRRGPENHRSARQAHRRTPEEERRRSARALARIGYAREPPAANRCLDDFFTHLECSRALRRAGPRSSRAPSSLRLRRSPARPLRSRRGPRLVARQPDRPAADDVALSRADADLRRRRAGHARRRFHAARARPDARRAPRPVAALHQGRVAQPDQLVQGARPVGRDHAGARARRDDDLAAVGGQRGQRRRRVRGAAPASRPRSSCPGT